MRVKFDENKLRTFGVLPRNTCKWKRLYNRRSALERINACVARDFNLERHYIHGLARMSMRVSLSMTTMMALAVSAIEAGEQKRMRSLVLPLAA